MASFLDEWFERMEKDAKRKRYPLREPDLRPVRMLKPDTCGSQGPDFIDAVTTDPDGDCISIIRHRRARASLPPSIMANPTRRRAPPAAAAAAAPAQAAAAAAAAGHPMEEYVLHVGGTTLLLSASAMINALAVDGDPPQVSPCHVILLFLLFALGICLIHVSPALRRFPRAVAVARALHRFLWEPRG